MQTGTFNPYDNVEIDYTYIPGEPQTRWEPGCPEEVELGEMRINGEPAGPDLEEDLYGLHGDTWEEKILEQIASDKADWQDARAEYLYEQHQEFLNRRG